MLVLAIGNIGFALLVAGYVRTAADNPAMGLWKWAKLIQGCAHLCSWLRPEFPSLYVIVAGNMLLILGTAVEAAAYCTFFGFARWKRVLYPFTALALVIFFSARFNGAAPGELVSLMSLIVALFTGAMAFILLRPGRNKSLLQPIIGINHLVFCVVMGLRAFSGLLHSDLTVFTPTAVQSLTYLTGYVLLIVNGFGFLLLCKEVDDRKMEELATIDSLTGLVNRRAFFARTSAARVLASRTRIPISLMMIDIDHFKNLNDRFGHATGDEALCVFATTAQTTLREHDIMGRLGGEEFALVLPGTALEGALQAAERLRLAISAAAVPTSNHSYNMTVSIGVVEIDAAEHINAALARADRALYTAKAGGRDRVECGELPKISLAVA